MLIDRKIMFLKPLYFNRIIVVYNAYWHLTDALEQTVLDDSPLFMVVM